MKSLFLVLSFFSSVVFADGISTIKVGKYSSAGCKASVFRNDRFGTTIQIDQENPADDSLKRAIVTVNPQGKVTDMSQCTGSPLNLPVKTVLSVDTDKGLVTTTLSCGGTNLPVDASFSVSANPKGSLVAIVSSEKLANNFGSSTKVVDQEINCQGLQPESN